MSSSFKTPAVITYSCNAGYSLRGVANASCDPTGNWSSLGPDCEATFSSYTAAPVGTIVGAAAGGAVMIIILFAIYRAYHGRSKASIRKPNEHQVHKDSVELNPAHASFDKSKLRTSFLYEETDLDHDKNNGSRASPFVFDADATLSVQAPRHDDHSSYTSYPHFNAPVPAKRSGDSSASFDNNESYEIAVNSSNFYQSRGPFASPYYSELKNADGSPYVARGDAMMDSYTIEGTGLQEVLASHRDTRYDFSTPSKIKPRMHLNGDDLSLDGTQEVYSRGHFPGDFDSYDVTVKTPEPQVPSPYYSSLRSEDGNG